MSWMFWMGVAAINGLQAWMNTNPIVKAVGFFACGFVAAIALEIRGMEKP